MCTRSNQINHPCNQVIDLHVHRMYFKALYLINDIKALIFHPIEHQDSESIPLLVCKCIISPRFRFTIIRFNLT